MADGITLEEMKAAAEQAGLTTTEFTNLAEALGFASTQVTTLAAGFIQGTSAAGVLNKAAEDLRNSFARLMPDKLEEIPEILGANADAMNSFGTVATFALADLFNLLPRGIDSFSKLGEAGMNAGRQLQDSWSRLPPLFKDMIPDGLQSGMENFLKTADQGRNVELGLMRAAAAGGDLNAVLQNVGTDLGGLSDEAASFAAVQADVAEATGVLPSTVAQYAEQLAKIPGALRENINLTDGSGRAMNALEATMKIADGTMFGMEGTMDILNKAFVSFGTRGDEALSLVARISSSAQTLGMRMDLVKDFTLGAADSFKFFGDNTESAITILSGMGAALRDSGIGQQAIIDLTKTMTDGIANMDTAHKAFISGAAGGRGGLAGALEIDFLQQQGRTDEVLKMVQAAMNQTAGPVITLEDARNNQQLAAQFVQQREMLKNVFGLARTDAQANRILEAMSRGDIAEFGEATTDTPERAMEDAAARGEAIQERQFNVQQHIAIQMEKLVMLQTLQAARASRELFGTEGAATMFLTKVMAAGSERAAGEGAIGAEGPARTTLGELTGRTFDEGKEALSTARSYMEPTINHLKEMKANLARQLMGGAAVAAGGAAAGAEDTVSLTGFLSGFAQPDRGADLVRGAPRTAPPVGGGVPRLIREGIPAENVIEGAATAGGAGGPGAGIAPLLNINLKVTNDKGEEMVSEKIKMNNRREDIFVGFKNE